VKDNRTGKFDKHLDPGSIYRNILRKYGRETGINAEVNGLCVHSLRGTAATNALSNQASIAKAQEWLGARERLDDQASRPAQKLGKVCA
jgi:integrase